MDHLPVLKDEITKEFAYLKDLESPVFVDGTLGAGGHALAIVKQCKTQKIKAIGIDKDQSALALSNKNIEAAGLKENFTLINDDFKNIGQILLDLNIERIDGALIDLGVSSMQLDNKDRGFSFQKREANLDMRMDQAQDFSAEDLVNTYSADDLAKIFFEYGEEQYGRNIAKNIARARTVKRIQTVGDLLDIIEKSVPSRYVNSGGKHFATRTFQAIRIEVNKELVGLGKALKNFVKYLAPGAKLAVITFHSLEDRIAKNVFKELATNCICPPKLPACVCGHKAEVKIVHKKPIIPSEEEIRTNPRARSAKLRIVEKI